MAYTIEDLERARQEQKDYLRLVSPYRRSDPRYGQSRMDSAANLIQEIEDDLKARGVLPYSARDKRDMALNAQFPNARPGDKVNFDGGRYRCEPKVLRFQGGKPQITRNTWEPMMRASGPQYQRR